MARIRQLTPRNWGNALDRVIARINRWLVGWHQFFRIAAVSEMQLMRKIDSHLRRRLRAIMLRHWKRRRTIVRNLIKLGVKRQAAWRGVYQGRQSCWALSHCHVVDHALPNRYFTGRGLLSVVAMHERRHEPIVAPQPAQLAIWE